MEIVLIANVDKDTFGIGYNNNLLVDDPKDKKRFYKLTTAGEDKNAVLMGYNTFKSLPGILKKRYNIVVTKDHTFVDDGDLMCVDNIEDGIICAKMKECGKLFVIGGQNIYKYFIDNCCYDRIELTFSNVYKGPIDVFFPRFDYKKHRIINDGQYSTFLRLNNMEEEDYLLLIQDIINNGEKKETRNAVTYSVFGRSLSFDLSNGFPLLTTKKVWFKGIKEELMWFLKGDTNVKNLQSKKVNIWNGNTKRTFLDNLGLNHYEEYDAGPIYGYQWRHWNNPYDGCHKDYKDLGIDQLKECINLLKNEPNSRRILFTGWNPEQLSEMSLPPCHVLYQFYVKNGDTLCCQMYQRSADIFLGLPFNIASTALLTHILAHYCDYKCGIITICIGDAHIYEQHMTTVKQQIQSIPLKFPKIHIKGEKPENIENYNVNNFIIEDYQYLSELKAEMIA